MTGGFLDGVDAAAHTSYGFSSGNHSGTTVANGATANTLGAWVQLSAASTNDAEIVGVNVIPSSSNGAGAMQLGIGASGSQQILIPMLGNETDQQTRLFNNYRFPLAIRAGTAIWVQSQAVAGATSKMIDIRTMDGSFAHAAGCAGVDMMGFISTTSLATKITAAGSVNTKGSWVQLATSTAHDYGELEIYIDGQATTSATAYYLVDIGIGASGSQIVLVPNIPVCIPATKTNTNSVIGPLPIRVPAGSALWARCQASVASAFVGCALYGSYQ